MRPRVGRSEGPGAVTSQAARRRRVPRPDVSIIVACYNAASTLADTIESIQAQTHENWEAVCVDDGSTDRTPDLLEAFAASDPRIRFTRIPHVGQPAAKNRGLQVARAERVMILDADDVARPDALAVLVRISQAAGDRAIVAPGYELLTQKGTPLSIFHFPVARDFSVDLLLRGNRLPSMALVPKSVLGRRAFDQTLRTGIDWELWLRLAHQGVGCVTVPRALIGYRLHGGSLSHNPDQMLASGRRIIERWLPQAREPEAAGDVMHRLACTYGAMGLACGAPDAIWRCFADLPPLRPGEDFHASVADSIHWGFEFVRGAAGATWRDNVAAWLAEIEIWLRDSPLAEHADPIRACLQQKIREPRESLDLVQGFVAGRPDTRRVVIYGVGTNGSALLEQLRSDACRRSYELSVADDHADPLVFMAHGLPRDDPRRWNTWPARTLVVVTPNEHEAMCATLCEAGGREGVDFVTLAGAAETARVPLT